MYFTRVNKLARFVRVKFVIIWKNIYCIIHGWMKDISCKVVDTY